MDIWYSSWKFGIFSRFGILCEEKSGNPGHHFVTLLCRLIQAFVTKYSFEPDSLSADEAYRAEAGHPVEIRQCQIFCEQPVRAF
jgi:hypothetical protein